MDVNDVRNTRFPNRIDKTIFNDISKSARHRSSLNIPNYVDRRTKTSLSEKDLINHDFREDSFNLFYQKQLPNKLSNQNVDKALIPSVVVRRKPEDKMKNPDRISLDRQNLTSCPILDNEDNVRLLNYQYNYINQIQHLDKLRKLILLDLYDNRIEKISGLDTLKSLRVLMLGRNRISKIEGLDALTRLDVLDLHANCLQIIENLNHLSDLRVLNLAGNNINSLTNLKGLFSLSEINVRRNCIESVVDINTTNCPNLQRIFLSYNNITKISDFSCLIDLVSLNELSMDNNPICHHNNFRYAVIFNFSQLEQLDSKIISEDDRNRAKQVINRLEMGSKSNSGLSRHLYVNNNNNNNNNNNGNHRTSNNDQSNNIQRFHSLKDRRKANSNNAQRILENWNSNGKTVSPRLSIKSFSNTSSSLYLTDLPNNNNNIMTTNDVDHDALSKSTRLNKSIPDFNNSIGKEFMAIEDAIVKPPYQHLGSPQSSSKKFVITRPSSSSSSLSKPESKSTLQTSGNNLDNIEKPSNNNQIYSVNITPETKPVNKNNVEIFNDGEQIQFCSNFSLKIFDDKEFWSTRTNLSSTVTVLIFQKIDFRDIEKIFFQIKARFPSVKKIDFQACNIHCYTQINAIANLKRLEELNINNSENPISSFTLIRPYIIFRLAHLGLKKFNDIEITDLEYITARRYFLSMAVIGPNQILQLHLINVLSDIRKRELLHSTANDQFISMSVYNSTLSQTPSVNLDLVGKSGLLSTISISESEDTSENIYKDLGSKAIDILMKSVEKQCDMEIRFHNQWISSIWQVIFNRLPNILSNRHEYMNQQFDKINSKLINNKSNVTLNHKK